MIRKYLLPFLAIVGLGAAIFMVIQGNRTVSVVQPVVQSAQAPFTSSIFGPGIVEASSENIAIGTPVSGIVTAIYVKWGDKGKAGGPLSKVKEVEAQLLPATAKVNEAEATAAKAENRLKVGEGLEPGVSISVEEMANRRYDTGINKAMVASAQAQVEQIKSQITSAKAQVELIARDLQ